MSIAVNSVRTFAERIERERDDYKSQAEMVKKELCRVKEERDLLREHFGALSLKSPAEPPPDSTTSENEVMQRFSSVGPLRRNSASHKSPRLSWATSLLKGQTRCKSADPCIPSRGDNDCFDVTSVAHPMPARASSVGKPPSPEFIRDASCPGVASRPAPLPYRQDEIDIHHIDILYTPLEGRVFCRACQ